VTYRIQEFLCNENVRTALRDGIRNIQTKHPFTIDGWVLLPNDLHCIWTQQEDDSNFGIRWAMIKHFITKRCGPDLCRNDWMNASKWKRNGSTLWQRRFCEHMIRDEDDFNKHMNYIHFNPVKHGLVTYVKDCPHSTFHRCVKRGFYPPDWGGVGTDTNYADYGE
jgi:putative transposase